MKNETGKPFAVAELNEDGWTIYFDPCPRLDGYYHYSRLDGPIGGDQAEALVKLMNENTQVFD